MRIGMERKAPLMKALVFDPNARPGLRLPNRCRGNWKRKTAVLLNPSLGLITSKPRPRGRDCRTEPLVGECSTNQATNGKKRGYRYTGVRSMFLIFDDRPSDSPFVERIWRCHSERAGTFHSIASSHWEMVVTRHQGKTTSHCARTGDESDDDGLSGRRRVDCHPLQAGHFHATAARKRSPRSNRRELA